MQLKFGVELIDCYSKSILILEFIDFEELYFFKFPSNLFDYNYQFSLEKEDLNFKAEFILSLIKFILSKSYDNI